MDKARTTRATVATVIRTAMVKSHVKVVKETTMTTNRKEIIISASLTTTSREATQRVATSSVDKKMEARAGPTTGRKSSLAAASLKEDKAAIDLEIRTASTSALR